MEEMLQIMFSAINKRVEMIENEIKNIYLMLEDVSGRVTSHNEKISELLLTNEVNKNSFMRDEMEEYKFGEQ